MTFRHVGFKKTNLRAGMHNHCLYGRHLTSPSSVYLLYYNSLFSRKLRVASCGICTDIKFFFLSFSSSKQMSQISTNLTTNERINKKRYAYLRGPSGIFLNPFDRGCLKNWLEYFHWVEPFDKKPNLLYNV